MIELRSTRNTIKQGDNDMIVLLTEAYLEMT